MTSKLRAERRGWEPELMAVPEEPALVDLGQAVAPASERTEIETEAAAVASWFGALPSDLRAYYDREAQSGREAYCWP